MRDFTTDGLVEGIKRRGSIPADQSTYEPADMLLIADDEMQTVIVPLIMSIRADHFLTYMDYTTTTDVTYAIPETALNRSLRSVVYVQADGSERPLDKIEFDEESNSADRGQRSFIDGAYYIRGDVVKLYPRSEAGKTLRMHYYQLPNRLVETSSAALVLSVDYDTNVVTCESVPADWASGDSVCCVAGRPGFSLRFDAQDSVNISSPTVTLSDASEVEAGDWIALEGDSPIPQIPVETHPLLAQAATVKILEGLGDPKIDVSEKKLTQIMEMYKAVTSVGRVEEGQKMLINRNRLVHNLP